MNHISPAAQAVMDAFRSEWPDEALKQDCKCLAAAFRAASTRMMYLCYDSINSKYLEGVEASSDFLDQIAIELEGK
jgi:hypothetical protein